MDVSTVVSVIKLVDTLAEAAESFSELQDELSRLEKAAAENDGTIPADVIEDLKQDRSDAVSEFMDRVNDID